MTRGPVRGLAAPLRAARDVYPTVLVFEDMQWADAALLDFIEYLLEWSRNPPLYVFTLARPELQEKRPTGRGERNFSRSTSSRCRGRRSSELHRGLVPGLPDELRRRILERAAGSSALRGRDRPDAARPRAVVREGPTARPARSRRSRSRDPARADRGPARRLAPDERRLLQDGAVLGKTFTVAAPRRPRRLGAGRPPGAARRPRAEGGAGRPVRSALARARAVRVPAGPGTARRI